MDSEKYGKVIVEGVSVFAENTSTQNIEMMEENNKGNFKSSQKEIVIPPQKLIMEGEIDKKQEALLVPYVLEDVYIPEFIIVHLGAPTSSAENVSVRFIDYIKNVALSEIYPTWPEEALKAKIYCQISFALNRIYTEWYRNKGYSFQITNSTAYDQYFVYGRNIFKNISKIVDEIFSIIKYYFGDDKELVRATIVEGIPESYPGTLLRLNDTNENVKVIQKQLNRIAKNFPVIPKIALENGKFGKDTEDLVNSFQKIFGLNSNGEVGINDWSKIVSVYKSLNSEKEINKCDKLPVFPGFPITLEDEDDYVMMIQKYINVLAKNNYGLKQVHVTGKFNEETELAVKKLQKEFGLESTGTVDKSTWNKLLDIYKALCEGKIFKIKRH